MKTSTKRRIVYWNADSISTFFHPMINEEPLSILIQGSPYAAVMRTPGDEVAHAAGLCLSDGIVDSPDDMLDLSFNGGSNADIVSVTLTSVRHERVRCILRPEDGPSGWGIAGKGLLRRLRAIARPAQDIAFMDIRLVYRLLEDLPDLQPLRHRTRASHAAAIFSSKGELLSASEDVGRHNALDKAVGKLFLSGVLASASLLILSSRISFELVQKAARAQLPIMVAVSRPTTLAVALASKLNITLACRAKESGLYIFTSPHRLVK